MACLEFNDGTKVYLSDEATNRLREELCKPVKEQLVVDRFRAIKEDGDFVRIAIMKYRSDKWDGFVTGNAEATNFLLYSEAKAIANGLLKMIGN